MNVAWKHLEERLRIADLTIAQWAGILLGALLGAVFAAWISPFGTAPTIFISIYVAGLPALAALLAEASEFDLVDFARSAWRWRREPGRYLPGAGDPTPGYRVVRDPGAGGAYEGREAPDLDGLWAL